MRCFTAIALPRAIKESLAETQAILRDSGVRAAWTLPDQLHLTLRYLGEIPDEWAAGFAERMLEALADEPAFELHARGAGCFPDEFDPAVVWAGVSGGDDRLARLNAIAEAEAQRAGCSPEPRPFYPHITLGRIHGPYGLAGFHEALAEARRLDAGAFRVSRVTLYESRLRRGGPVYAKLEEFKLRDE
jgi:2'-5' RNA ligase